MDTKEPRQSNPKDKMIMTINLRIETFIVQAMLGDLTLHLLSNVKKNWFKSNPNAAHIGFQIIQKCCCSSVLNLQYQDLLLSSIFWETFSKKKISSSKLGANLPQNYPPTPDTDQKLNGKLILYCWRVGWKWPFWWDTVGKNSFLNLKF